MSKVNKQSRYYQYLDGDRFWKESFCVYVIVL